MQSHIVGLSHVAAQLSGRNYLVAHDNLWHIYLREDQYVYSTYQM